MDNKKIFSILTIVVVVGLLFVYSKQGMFTTKEADPDYGIDESKAIDTSKGYGVSASHPLAVEAGMEVLEKGGNAADAAVAVSYVLGVVEPFGSGIGGGGEMLIYPQDEEVPLAYEYREVAPQSGAVPETFGIPGFVKGMEAINDDYGSKSMEELIQPAIDYAEEGFPVDQYLINRLKKGSHRMAVENMPSFFPDGQVLELNEELKQPELASSLKTIQEEGAEGFYSGEIADLILQHEPGLTEEDLSSYSISTHQAVKGTFAGYDVYSAPPPLAGATLIQSLQMADLVDFSSVENESKDYYHLISEITKKSYAERIKRIGDPDFSKVAADSLDEIVTLEHSKQLADTISLENISESGQINDSVSDDQDHDNTTHFVIIDEEGTMVSTTHTLGNFFGSGDYVGGFFMNNQMEHFSQKTHSINSVQPGKTARSFISPTILTNGDKMIGIGSPGGKRIPTVMTQVLIKHLIYDEPLEKAVNAKRIYIEDDNSILTEAELDTDAQASLRKMGYELFPTDSQKVDFYGGIQALVIDKGEEQIYGAADPRRGGSWLVNTHE